MKWVTLISASLAFLIGCTDQMKPPERPQKVPPEAVWAGGVDGGAWFLCKEVINKPVHYDCTIYNDYTGDIGTQGRFALRGYGWDEGKKQAIYSAVEPAKELQFRSYDGEKIYLKGSLVLLPDGVIDHPFGNGHGKKQRYELGKPVGPELEY